MKDRKRLIWRVLLYVLIFLSVSYMIYAFEYALTGI